MTGKGRWFRDCVSELTSSLAAASQFLPVNTVIVSSFAPAGICRDIAEAINAGSADVTAVPGELQLSPKALGAASLPFSSKFTVDT